MGALLVFNTYKIEVKIFFILSFLNFPSSSLKKRGIILFMLFFISLNIDLSTMPVADIFLKP